MNTMTTMTTMATVTSATTMTTETAIQIQIQFESDLVNQLLSDTADYYLQITKLES